jgi:hypothetical protein
VTALTKELESIGTEIAAELTRSFSDGAGVFISTPLLYPGGSHVVVWLDGAGDQFTVSDHGYARLEAELMAGDRIFPRIAADISKNSGIGFDNNCFSLSGVGRQTLPAAVTLIANLSKEAADQTAQRLSENRYSFGEEQLVQRLASVFGINAVSTSVNLIGASTHRWQFHAAVLSDDHLTVFDLVKPSPQSIYPAVAKFSDIAELADGPQRVVVLADKEKTDLANINLLSRSAKIISLLATDTIYRSAA